jgi:hypothetical protein
MKNVFLKKSILYIIYESLLYNNQFFIYEKN